MAGCRPRNGDLLLLRERNRAAKLLIIIPFGLDRQSHVKKYVQKGRSSSRAELLRKYGDPDLKFNFNHTL